MKLEDCKESGVYIATGPAEWVSVIPTENILFLYEDGTLVHEGDEVTDIHLLANLEVELVAKTIDFPSLKSATTYVCSECNRVEPFDTSTNGLCPTCERNSHAR